MLNRYYRFAQEGQTNRHLSLVKLLQVAVTLSGQGVVRLRAAQPMDLGQVRGGMSVIGDSLCLLCLSCDYVVKSFTLRYCFHVLILVTCATGNTQVWLAGLDGEMRIRDMVG